MSFTNTPERYGVISAAFHWLSAIIVYGMFALGLWMVTLSYYDGWYHKAPELHKSIGILLMMGLVIRVLWRVISPPPGPLPSYSPMTRLAAKAGHLALYLLLFAIGISGYLISTADGKPISVFGWFDVPATLADAPRVERFDGAQGTEVKSWIAPGQNADNERTANQYTPLPELIHPDMAVFETHQLVEKRHQ